MLPTVVQAKVFTAHQQTPHLLNTNRLPEPSKLPTKFFSNELKLLGGVMMRASEQAWNAECVDYLLEYDRPCFTWWKEHKVVTLVLRNVEGCKSA